MSSQVKEKNLHDAVQSDDIPCIHRLLAAGADINAKDSYNRRTPLYYARGDTTAILVEAKADFHTKDQEGRTPLHVAVSLIDHKKVNILLEAKAHVYAKDDQGQTVLHLAPPWPPLIATLLQAKALINDKNKKGETVLYKNVVNYFKKDVVELLIQAKADLFAKDNSGNTAADKVRSLDRGEAADDLQSYRLLKFHMKRQRSQAFSSGFFIPRLSPRLLNCVRDKPLCDKQLIKGILGMSGAIPPFFSHATSAAPDFSVLFALERYYQSQLHPLDKIPSNWSSLSAEEQSKILPPDNFLYSLIPYLEEARNFPDQTLLKAAKMRNLGLARLALKYGANVNHYANEFNKETALMRAATNGDLDMVKSIVVSPQPIKMNNYCVTIYISQRSAEVLAILLATPKLSALFSSYNENRDNLLKAPAFEKEVASYLKLRTQALDQQQQKKYDNKVAFFRLLTRPSTVDIEHAKVTFNAIFRAAKCSEAQIKGQPKIYITLENYTFSQKLALREDLERFFEMTYPRPALRPHADIRVDTHQLLITGLSLEALLALTQAPRPETGSCIIS